MANLTMAERFASKVSPEPTSGCWLWDGQVDLNGYARISRGPPWTRITFGHRVAWELHRGPIPTGLSVLHRCDVPGCVNPDHLFLGTQADNMADMNAKGRGNFPKMGTTCQKGHPFEFNGRRNICRACAREYYRRYNRKRAA
jgi:hypothetical protein